MQDRSAALAQIADIARHHGLRADEVLLALDDTAASPQTARSSGILAHVLAYLGGIFLLAGIALFIGMQWDDFNSATRVLMTLGTGFTLFLLALLGMSDLRFYRVTTPLLLLAAVLQPTGLMVMLNEYATGENVQYGLLFMSTVMLMQQLLVFLARRRTVLLFTSVFFGAAACGTLCKILNIQDALVLILLGSALTTLSWFISRSMHRSITPFWYLVGAALFLLGAFQLLEHTPLEILYFGLAAGVMYLGTVLRSRSLLFCSVVALMVFTGYFFRDSLGNALGLIVMGLLLIGLSALAMGLSRRYIQQRV